VVVLVVASAEAWVVEVVEDLVSELVPVQEWASGEALVQVSV
jgi:hypothetical protein